MITRAKYYVSNNNVTTYYPHLNQSVSGFAEVFLNAVYSPDPLTENYQFWSSSPSGKMQIRLTPEDALKFGHGTFWYIDVEPWEEDAPFTDETYQLTSLVNNDNYNLGIKLMKVVSGGHLDPNTFFEVNIANKVVWPLFHNQLDSKFRLSLKETTREGS